MTKRAIFRSDILGSAAAELVLALPIVLVLLIGASEVSHYMYVEHQVIKGVRDGARYGSRQSFVDANCDSGTPSTLSTAVETAIKEVTRTGQISGGTARVNGWVNGDITISITCPATAITTGIYKGSDNAPQINVSAQVTYNSLFGNLGFVNFDGKQLNASQQAAVFGI